MALTQLHATLVARAYLGGVLHGDGWCSESSCGLHVKDRDFAEAFAVALEIATGSVTRPRLDGKYWRVSNRNDSGRFDSLRHYEPQSDAERCAWLRGLFDSEGNAQLRPPKRWPNSHARRVAIYSTNLETLTVAMDMLRIVGITASIYPQKASATHLGAKPVYELKLINSSENYLRFYWAIGSSIERKQSVLRAIPLTYVVDPADTCRRAQAVGVERRRASILNMKLPTALAALKSLIDSGQPVRAAQCANVVPHYAGLVRYFRHGELVDMARGVVPVPDCLPASNHCKRGT